MLQAAVIALVLGALFRGTSAAASSALWPYLVGGYGLLAATVPWLTGGLGRSDFSLRLSAILGIVFALPLCVSAYWLSSSPYLVISVGCWALAAAWGVHLVVSVIAHITRR